MANRSIEMTLVLDASVVQSLTKQWHLDDIWQDDSKLVGMSESVYEVKSAYESVAD